MTPDFTNLSREDRLRRQIYLAPPGVTIYVEPGEHNGPFVFSRPISLIGKSAGNTAATLITLRGPVVIVQSPNVHLENLEFLVGDGDFRTIDPVLVHAPYCQPTLKDVRLGKGRIEDMTNVNQTSGWELPSMVAFGDLREKASVALPLDVRVPGPTAIKSQLADMKVEPDHLPGAGEYRLIVHFLEGVLMKDSLMVGQLVFDCPGESRTVWIIGNVLPEKDFKAKGYPEFTMSAPSGRLYSSTDTFMLGRAQFQSERGAERWSDGLAFIIHETADVWSLVQTRPQSIPLRLNRQLLPVGQRQVLKENDELEIGDMKFRVLPKDKKPSQDVSKSINFGKLSAPGTLEAKLEVENRSKIANWEGKLRSTVPWIVLPGERFICPRGQKVSIQLGLDVSQLGKLPAGLQPIYGALVLENDKEAWVVKALLHVDIDISKISLEIQPRTLDFKKVTRPENHPGLKVGVRNTGSLPWTGTVRSAKWLTAIPTSLTIAPGKTSEVAVNPNANIDSLLEGPNSESEALVFEGQQVRETTAARIDVERPRANLQVQPAELDFGVVKEWHSTSLRLLVNNAGAADWQGELKTNFDALEIVDSRGQLIQGVLRLPAQTRVELSVRLKQAPPPGTYLEPTAVQWVRDNKSEITLPLKMVIEEIKIEADPGMIDFKLTNDPTSREKVFRIWNRSGQEWLGEVKSNLSWLVVNPTKVRIPPNKLASVTVTVVMSQVQSNERLRNNKVKPVADAILLQAGGVTLVQVGASIFNSPGNIVDPPPPPPPPPAQELVLETTSVDYGKLPSPTDSLPAREILLSNPGDQPVECSVQTLVNWLNVEPLRFTILPKQQFRLKALLNEAARKLTPDNYVREDGVQVAWNNRPHNVRVALQVVEKPQPPSQEKIDFGLISIPVQKYAAKEISIYNPLFYPAAVMAHSTVPWLTVTSKETQCPAKGTCVVTVALNPGIIDLPEGLTTQPDAVVVEIAQKPQSYAVLLNVEKATITNRPPKDKDTELPREYVIDFGVVSDLSAGLPSRSFQLTNHTSQPKDGKVLATNFIWLTVSPMEFHVEPNNNVDLKVQLNKNARVKVYDEERAIIIELSGTQIPIRVKADVRKSLASFSMPGGGTATIPPRKVEPTPPIVPTYPELNLAKGLEQLAALENLFDFGGYLPLADPLPSRTLALTNTSNQSVSGVVKIIDVPWLSVDPVRFECPAGGSVLVQVSLNDAVRTLRARGKPYKAADAICIETVTQTFCLRASVQVQTAAAP